MNKLIAIFGWKYVKDITNGKFHHYKCKGLKGIYNRETFNKSGMKEDLAKHPYSVRTDNCLDGIV